MAMSLRECRRKGVCERCQKERIHPLCPACQALTAAQVQFTGGAGGRISQDLSPSGDMGTDLPSKYRE